MLLLREEELETAVGLAEPLKDLRGLLTVARGVVLRIHWIYDSKLHLVVLRHRKRVERLVVYSIYSQLAWVERIAVEVEETHQQARGRQIGTLLQLIEVHITHD